MSYRSLIVTDNLDAYIINDICSRMKLVDVHHIRMTASKIQVQTALKHFNGTRSLFLILQLISVLQDKD